MKQAVAAGTKEEKLDADCREYEARAEEAESVLASAWRGKPVHGKLTHLGRAVVASAVMLQEAVTSATIVGRLQNEKKRLVEQLNKEKCITKLPRNFPLNDDRRKTKREFCEIPKG